MESLGTLGRLGRLKTPGEALEEWNAAVDLESMNYHCDAIFLVLNQISQGSVNVRAIMDSGLGMTFISNKIAARMVAHFEGV